MDRWVEVSITLPEAAADAMSDRLIGAGAPGVIEEDAEGGLTLRAHFREPPFEALRSFLETLEREFPGSANARIEMREIAEEDWAEGWKQNFPPLEVGGRLRIRSPWTQPIVDGRLDVEILPARAFGTGQHASTLGCLLALEECFGEASPASVLDVGTGSGILAIAAARLGATRVVGVDTDPVALEAAAENLERNGLTRTIRLVLGGADQVPGQFAFVVANLFADLLCESFPRFAARSAADARLVVAGLLDRDRASVTAAARESGFEPIAMRSLEGWTTLVFRRR